ncbi:HlyC/CorC family transporter [Burkholderiaceae bacterium DAT-1]|nr:HlyC/CorC family transporter [Burkholderiaceae bacterium DAT-1]
MEDIPISWLFAALIACLFLSAFFSASETAMMSLNRYKLNSHARSGNRMAMRTRKLIQQTDRLLGVLLLGNTLFNTLSATLSTLLSARLFAGNELALAIATLIVGFAILVVAEAAPKVIAAAHAQRFSYIASYPLSLILTITYPAVWFVNLFVQGILRAFRIKTSKEGEHLTLSREELRMLVLDAGGMMPQKNHSVLVNTFELDQFTVEDVMTPRNLIEAIDLSSPIETIRDQLTSCHHTRLPVYRDNTDTIIGILHVKRLLHHGIETLSHESFPDLLREPYFVPAGTPLFTQLQAFQESQRRLALVVDEYGDLIGLLTLEDILEQLVGEFTSTTPMHKQMAQAQSDGSTIIDGQINLRDLNRKLGTQFPLDGPKTLNGLILEYLESIPESATCIQAYGQRMEIMQTHDRQIRSVRLYA